MKVLLLTDLPPCENYSGGLALASMVRFMPRRSICCFVAADPTLRFSVPPDLSGIPMAVDAKPIETWSWLPQRGPMRLVARSLAFGGEQGGKLAAKRLVDRAVAFGRAQGVDRVWATLQGQTMIRMAADVADRLGMPLHSLVWDAYRWWAVAHQVDRWSAADVQRRFDDTIRRSATVAAASEPMAEDYRNRLGATAIPVISSLPRNVARTPGPHPGDKDILIGMAGQFYAAAEWGQLLRAMEMAGWRVAGRAAHIVVLGPHPPPGADGEHVTYLGWKPQAEAARILSACDILYCPYPFDPAMREVATYSFPSKLVLYLAAGRPVVLHGPTYAAPAQYIARRRCGVVADRPASAVYNALERLVRDGTFYGGVARAAQSAFAEDFTLETMHARFTAFIDPGNRDWPFGLHDHGTGEAIAGPMIVSVDPVARRRSALYRLKWLRSRALAVAVRIKSVLRGGKRRLRGALQQTPMQARGVGSIAPDAPTGPASAAGGPAKGVDRPLFVGSAESLLGAATAQVASGPCDVLETGFPGEAEDEAVAAAMRRALRCASTGIVALDAGSATVARAAGRLLGLPVTELAAAPVPTAPLVPEAGPSHSMGVR